ncbi:MAG: NYN domain-containing protein [Clostridium perfringens]
MEEINSKKHTINASIYVDYENILRRLRVYGVHPINDLDFFRKLGIKLKEKNLNILDYIAYANFDDADLGNKAQTQIKSHGVNTKHTNNDGKTCSDLALAVDVITDLYKNDNIEVFIIVSCDRDFIPIMTAIKRENKKVITISLKEGSNSIINIFSNACIYIEDLFEFEKNGIKLKCIEENNINDNIQYEGEITEEIKDNAKKAAGLLYSSNLWNSYKKSGELIGLNGYANMLSRYAMKEYIQKDIIDFFKVAHKFGWVNIYIQEDKLYLKEGENRSELQ